MKSRRDGFIVSLWAFSNNTIVEAEQEIFPLTSLVIPQQLYKKRKMRQQQHIAALCYFSLLSPYKNIDNQCKDQMYNDKDCRVGQLTMSAQHIRFTIFKPSETLHLLLKTPYICCHLKYNECATIYLKF